MTSPAAKPWFKDWTYYACPGPTRKFSAEEMARGGDQPWPAGVDQYIVVSTTLVVALGALFQWSASIWALAALYVLVITSLSLYAARQLWRSPTRLRLNLTTFFGALVLVEGLLLPSLYEELDRKEELGLALTLSMAFVVVQAALWFLTMYRVQQIEARLRELDDRAVQQRLMNRLATAQIHPHFVFNTLASLTHWVESGDARAAPLLRDFSAYLRATLPMFEREQQPLAEELELVRRYLTIMQARMGERLQWQVEHDASLDALPLPPGSLLTLVENAVTHGIEPSLRGGRIEVHTAPGRPACITVRNTGEDLDPSAPEGLGLSNTRERLVALGAGLQLRALHPGCEAVITLPA
ncbi:sensor histidine kinase [Inhella sp.]|uniref:sensor histidine kinase n=1 Tax=Inhella sp. TaxID=1921806 RepID=UPI0035B395A1